MVKISVKYRALGQIRSSFTKFNSVWGFCFSSYKLPSISLYTQINHFSFCLRKTCNSWKQISQITPHYCSRKDVSSRYFDFSVSSADTLDAIEASEIALDDCLQATELYPGPNLCLPVEVLPLRHLRRQYYLESITAVPIMVRGEVMCNSYKVETHAPGCHCFSYWTLTEVKKKTNISLKAWYLKCL